jgi:LysM repeat protein
MGSIIGPANARSFTLAILTLAALIVGACVAFAAPADFSERDLSPPPRRVGAKSSKAVVRPTKAVEATTYSEESAAPDDNDEDTSEDSRTAEPAPAPGLPPALSREAADADGSADQSGAAVQSGGDLSYVIHQGDSVGALSGMFHIPAADIFRRNHLTPESTLRVGQVLRIPNPYTAQVHQLQAQIGVLQSREKDQERRLQDANTREGAYNARVVELNGINRVLEHDVITLPWWRRVTTLAVTLATLMFGIALVSLFQWFLVRRRFVSVALANERLSRLDQRYRNLLARSELRLQQLYGRRRAPADTAGKNPDDFEIERLNRELKDVLEQQMAQLGVQFHAPARRSRFREWLANLGSRPVAVRSDRR